MRLSLKLQNIESLKIKMTINIMFFVIIFFLNCEKEVDSGKSENGFKLSSSEIGADSLLPVDYTCDGISATLPVKWTCTPSGTVSFVLIMHHEASPEDIHCYWILYNISSDVDSLPRNVSDIGTLGTNSINDKTQYSPPCSQGPGIRNYIFTLYALSQKPVITVSSEKVNRSTILDAIKDITISSAKMTVSYTRDIQK
jgi:phosphatidylethanolamine-binding protein (PEBP) family uncharacterized protein